jgi:hypothetical protein
MNEHPTPYKETTVIREGLSVKDGNKDEAVYEQEPKVILRRVKEFCLVAKI